MRQRTIINDVEDEPQVISSGTPSPISPTGTLATPTATISVPYNENPRQNLLPISVQNALNSVIAGTQSVLTNVMPKTISSEIIPLTQIKPQTQSIKTDKPITPQLTNQKTLVQKNKSILKWVAIGLLPFGLVIYGVYKLIKKKPRNKRNYGY